MNIFKLDSSPKQCAEWMTNSHVVKMVVETAQLLSTAHRVLDGDLYYDKTTNGRSIKRWRLSNPEKEQLIYKASHVNHPSAIWARKTNNNYTWLYCHFVALCDEYTYRYNKIHKTDTLLREALKELPANIPVGPLTLMPSAMDEQYVISSDPIVNYRNYYSKGKAHLHKWTKREQPAWL